MSSKTYKHIISILSLALAFSLGCQYTTIKASNNIQSQGKLVYNNEVVLDTNDLGLLKSELDLLKNETGAGYIEPTQTVIVDSVGVPSDYKYHEVYSKEFDTDTYLRATYTIDFPTNSSGGRVASLFINGVKIYDVQMQACKDIYTVISMPAHLKLKAGDKLSIILYQNSGTTLNCRIHEAIY